MLVTTAYLDEAERCAQVFVLHEGRLLAQGAPEEIRAPRARACASSPRRRRDQRRASCRRACSMTPEAIIDAVPQGGAVRFIRRPEADQQRWMRCSAAPPASRSSRAWKTASWCCCARGRAAPGGCALGSRRRTQTAATAQRTDRRKSSSR